MALAQVFTSEFCEISKNTFFREHLWTTASILFWEIYFCKPYPQKITSVSESLLPANDVICTVHRSFSKSNASRTNNIDIWSILAKFLVLYKFARNRDIELRSWVGALNAAWFALRNELLFIRQNPVKRQKENSTCSGYVSFIILFDCVLNHHLLVFFLLIFFSISSFWETLQANSN